MLKIIIIIFMDFNITFSIIFTQLNAVIRIGRSQSERVTLFKGRNFLDIWPELAEPWVEHFMIAVMTVAAFRVTSGATTSIAFGEWALVRQATRVKMFAIVLVFSHGLKNDWTSHTAHSGSWASHQDQQEKFQWHRWTLRSNKLDFSDSTKFNGYLEQTESNVIYVYNLIKMLKAEQCYYFKWYYI